MMPVSVSSAAVRAASASAEAWARVTSTIRVSAGSARAATAAAYVVRCLSKPAKGPRQDASPFPVARNEVQAPGSCSSRTV